MVHLNNVKIPLPLLWYRILPFKYVVWPQKWFLLWRGHQCWSTSLETSPGQTGSTGINESSALSLSYRKRPVADTAALPQEPLNERFQQQERKWCGSCSPCLQLWCSYLYLLPTWRRWASTTVRLNEVQMAAGLPCKACSATQPFLAHLCSLCPKPQLCWVKAERTAKGPATSINCHGSTSDLDLAHWN